jgi:BirA family biotin operon repressor/biotin-[acetyl-CoA-carboxylase] ligase
VISAGAPFVVLDEIDSTNEEARRRFQAGDLQPAWLLAKAQTAGRGRRGRSWTTIPGNMFLTYHGVATEPPARIALLGFVAGLALADVCAPLVGEGVAQLKWPNDLLLNGAKAAGILLEAASAGAEQYWFALGVGLNIVGAPDDVGQQTAALKAFAAAPPSPVSIAQAFAERAGHWAARLQHEGFEPLRQAWTLYARGIGQTVEVDLGGSRVEGVMQGLSEGGELVLTLANGETKLIAAGDLYFPHLASV